MTKYIYMFLLVCITFFAVAKADDYQSRLTDDKQQILRSDIDDDGDVDILERWFNGKRCRWFDENDDMLATDMRGDIVSDCVQIDMNGDGIYDGIEDMSVKWVDNDEDGTADAQVIAINHKEGEEYKWAGRGLYMVIEDVDNDNVMGYIDWSNFDLACWRNTGRCNFSPDYNGDSVFLKAHLTTFAVGDAKWNWENPFAFYDFDDDGCTEMSVRLIDDFNCDRDLDSAYISIDIDNDSQRDNELDYDFSLLFKKESAYDYKEHVNEYPDLKAPSWVLPYFQYTQWRMIDELVYVPHEKCFDTAFEIEWTSCYFTFDEDDDDHRWERVELYNPGDPYTLRWTEEQQKSGKWPINSHAQADTLGDRGEFDTDNSGKGKLYISKWDGRLHLYGAEWGAWTIDSEAKYNGAILLPNVSSKVIAKKLESVVRYYDKDGNGFFDFVEYDFDADGNPELSVNLLDYGSDEYEIIDPAEVKWQGVHDAFKAQAKASWNQAIDLYRAFWRKGLSQKETDDLAFASSIWERYSNSLKLKEAIFLELVEKLKEDEDKKQILYDYYFSGNFAEMAKWILTLDMSNE